MRSLTFAFAAAALSWCCLSAQLDTGGPLVGQGTPIGRVTGKPYSATQITNTAQTLANGTHIVRKTAYRVYQDDQGRFRTEPEAGGVSVIRDPVAMVNYSLDLVARSARKSVARSTGAEVAARAMEIAMSQRAREMTKRRGNVAVEDLGKQLVNGVMASGVLITTTIPLGSIGNDQELKSVEERWFSDEIHALVKSVVTDPRTGVYDYELINIVRGAQDPALFQIPAGFTVTTAPGPFIKQP